MRSGGEILRPSCGKKVTIYRKPCVRRQRTESSAQSPAGERPGAAEHLCPGGDLQLQALPLRAPLLHAEGRRGGGAVRHVQGPGPAPAVPAGERDEGGGHGAGERVPQGRGLPALLRRAEPRRGGGPPRGLRAAQGEAVEGGPFRRGPQKAPAGLSGDHRHHHLLRGGGGSRYDPYPPAAVSPGQGEAAAGPSPGGGGPGGDRGGPALRLPPQGGGCDHHRPGRRVHRGPVGLQRRAGSPGHL